ncbi:MAG: asparagine synthase-related protein, partial [Candidatus Rokuibacteriota bacterium]
LVERLLEIGRFPEGLSECVGEFSLALLDRRTGQVSLASDCLGIRPLFYATVGDGVVFGSDVWPIFASGRIAPAVDYDGLASWIHFNYPQGRSTLFRDIHKIPPGALVRIGGGQVTAVSYVRPRPRALTRDRELVEEIDDIVAGVCKGLTRGHSSVAVFLSGGFDSRYIACVLKRQGLECVAYTVPYESGDAELAPVVASRLGIPLQSVPITSSLDDAYGEPLRWSPAGFPIGKFVTSLLVERFGMTGPTADGFLGDTLIRPWDPVGFSVAISELAGRFGSLAEGIVRHQSQLDPLVVFEAPLARRIRQRVIAQIEALLRSVDEPEECKLALWLLYNRKANWLASNHLQNLEATEGFHPFYSRKLIELRLSAEPSRLNLRLYRQLFERLYPEVANVPHSGDVRNGFNAGHRWSWFHWRRLPELAGELRSAPWAREAIRRGRVTPRLAAYLMGIYRWNYVVRYLYPVAVLMRRLRENGMEVNWKEL